MKMLQTVPTTDNDYIRNKVADLVSEDSTYYPYKADITVDSVGRDLGQDRLIRWKFALDLFVKEYTWKEKIFGGGFDFLGWYGKVFKGDHMKPDYPHNPFLHILLYGGIVGLSLYFWLLARVLQLYWRYRKEYGIFLLMWGVVYYFTLFSGGDPFNPPVMGFFMLLPFLIHAVHQREAKE
jgi:O-antigen ligase